MSGAGAGVGAGGNPTTLDQALRGTAGGTRRKRTDSGVTITSRSYAPTVPTVVTAGLSRRQLLVGIVFTLDDTLFDSTGTLAAPAYKSFVTALSTLLPELSSAPDAQDQAQETVRAYMSSVGSSRRVADLIEDLVREGRLSPEHALAAQAAYHKGSMENVDSVKLFPDAVNTLVRLRQRGYVLGLLTRGNPELQNAKIDRLGLRQYFDAVLVSTFADTKKAMRNMAKMLGVRIAAANPGPPRQGVTQLARPTVPLVVVGNKIMSEISVGNRLGFITVRVQQGHYARLVPARTSEVPDYTIARLSSVLGVMDVAERAMVPIPRITCIGGGTGMPLVLKALNRYDIALSAIVTVFDSGRSSGMMRRELGILPPGDVRNCLVALSDRDDDVLKQVMNFRFSSLNNDDGSRGAFHGTSCGNLILAALTKIAGGSFAEAVRLLSSLLGVEAAVIPVTDVDTHLKATLADGTTRVSEVHVRQPGKPPIVKLELENSQACADPAALSAIEAADGIIMGPGSMYTSIIATLLPIGMKNAVANAPGLRVYVANLTAQAGQTDGMTLRQHVVLLERYLRSGVPQTGAGSSAGAGGTAAGGGNAGAGDRTAVGKDGEVPPDHPDWPSRFRCVDVVVANNADPGPEVMASYMTDGVVMLLPQPDDAHWFADRGVQLVATELMDTTPRSAEFDKALMPKHDLSRVAQVLQQICQPSTARRMKAAARVVASAKAAVEGEGPAVRIAPA